MAKIAVLGAGGFGTSLAVMAALDGHETTLWAHRPETLEKLAAERENKRLLPGIAIPQSVRFSSDIAQAAQADLILLATPSHAVRETGRRLAEFLPVSGGPVVASVAKGLELSTLNRLSQVLEQELGRPCVMLSGPSHAEELARQDPTTVVAASARRELSEYVQEMLMSPALRIYVSDDLVGVELGGALKNVIALAAGVCTGLNFGDNAKAALMTRGITEIARLGVSMGAKAETFAGLSGIGDLIVTCTSVHSRNRQAGIYIGQGNTPEQAMSKVGSTVEGYRAAKAAYELAAQRHVEMPIVEQVYQVLYEGKPAQQAVSSLMGRPKRHESEVIWLLSR